MVFNFPPDNLEILIIIRNSMYMLPFDLSLFQTSYWHYYDSVLAAVSIFAYRGIFFLAAKLQIIIDIEHINRHKNVILCHLANFHYAI